MAYLFISHDLGVVRYLSDRIAVLYLGQLMELGDGGDGVRPAQHPYTEALLSSVPERGGRASASGSGSTGEIPVGGPSAVGLRLPHPLPALHRRQVRNERAASSRRSSPATSCAATYSVEELRELQKTAPPEQGTARRSRRRGAP